MTLEMARFLMLNKNFLIVKISVAIVAINPSLLRIPNTKATSIRAKRSIISTLFLSHTPMGS